MKREDRGGCLMRQTKETLDGWMDGWTEVKPVGNV